VLVNPRSGSQNYFPIIDAVQPTRTFYTLETMPWMYPDSPQSYLRLLQAVDRRQFAVHFAPDFLQRADGLRFLDLFSGVLEKADGIGVLAHLSRPD